MNYSNKITLQSFIYLLILILLFGYSCTEDTNIVKTYYSNGNIKELYYIDEDSLTDGLYKKYNIRGLVIKEIEYTHGMKNGMAIIRRNSNGNVQYKINYINDKKDGEFYEYYPNGTIKLHGYNKADSVEFFYFHNRKGVIADVFRNINLQYDTNSISLLDTLQIKSYLCGPLSDTNEILGNYIVEYPFGMIKQHAYIINNDGIGEIKIPFEYPGTYSIIILNNVIGEKYEYSNKININVMMNSSLHTENTQFYENSELITRFNINDGGKDTVVFYHHKQNVYK